MRSVMVIGEPERARELLDSGRLQLLAALDEQPDSAAGLARRLGEKRQRLNYHLRALETAGFIEVASEKAHGGLAERVYRPAARRYLVDPVAGQGGVALAPAERGSADHLMLVAARLVHELGGLDRTAGEAGVAAPSLDAVVRLDSADVLEEFAGALGGAIAEVVGRYHRAGSEGVRVRLVAGMHMLPVPGSRPAV